jgi:hypothetical protein
MNSKTELRKQVNWHSIDWYAFNDVKAMIERADAQEGVALEEYPKGRRKHRHIVHRRVRDAHVKH